MLLLSKVENDRGMVVVGNAWLRVETHWKDGLVLCGGVDCPLCQHSRAREKWYGAVLREGDRLPCLVEISGECYRMLERAFLTEYSARFALHRRTRRERWRLSGSQQARGGDTTYLVDRTAMEQAIFRLLDVPPRPEKFTFNQHLWNVARKRFAAALPGQQELPFDPSLAKPDPSIYIV